MLEDLVAKYKQNNQPSLQQILSKILPWPTAYKHYGVEIKATTDVNYDGEYTIVFEYQSVLYKVTVVQSSDGEDYINDLPTLATAKTVTQTIYE
jgi:hypothetical protein